MFGCCFIANAKKSFVFYVVFWNLQLLSVRSTPFTHEPLTVATVKTNRHASTIVDTFSAQLSVMTSGKKSIQRVKCENSGDQDDGTATPIHQLHNAQPAAPGTQIRAVSEHDSIDSELAANGHQFTFPITRPWSKEEDAMLRQAIQHQLKLKKPVWVYVAASVSLVGPMHEGRTAIQCRHRWASSVLWTKDENRSLLAAHVKHKGNWKLITQEPMCRGRAECLVKRHFLTLIRAQKSEQGRRLTLEQKRHTEFVRFQRKALTLRRSHTNLLNVAKLVREEMLRSKQQDGLTQKRAHAWINALIADAEHV